LGSPPQPQNPKPQSPIPNPQLRLFDEFLSLNKSKIIKNKL